MIKIKIQENKLNPDHADYSANLANLAFMADLRNAKKETAGDTIHYFISPEKVSFQTAKQLDALGVDCEGLQLYIDTSVECPFTYTDEEGVEQDYTWETWVKFPYGTLIETTDKTYVGSAGNNGVWKTVSELSAIIDSCIDNETLKSKLPAPNIE